ncbi:MAG TPA: tRNA (adenosine(37)-N6)-threonylcarbamoyltransferase complex ATPase subunit type 1 TsaE [Candidatus Acidoferrales bacterium]
MNERKIESKSAEETISIGREIGAALKAPVLVLLTGELGAGKTTLTKGIVSGAGATREEEITSPTFTLIHKYVGPSKAGDAASIYHIDLYRIEDAQDLATLGLDDIFDERAIVIVEWPDRMNAPAKWPIIQIGLEHVSEEVRNITVRSEKT